MRLYTQGGGGTDGEKLAHEWMDTVQCGREPEDIISTACDENEAADHLTQLGIT